MNAKMLIVVFLVGSMVWSTRARSLANENGAEEHTTFFHHRFHGGIGFGGRFGKIPGFGGAGAGGLGGGGAGAGMGGGFGGNSGAGSSGGSGSGGRSNPGSGSGIGELGNRDIFDEISPRTGKGGAKVGGGLEDGTD